MRSLPLDLKLSLSLERKLSSSRHASLLLRRLLRPLPPDGFLLADPALAGAALGGRDEPCAPGWG